jgi:hypothetical protein
MPFEPFLVEECVVFFRLMLAAMQIRFLGLAGVGLISVGYYSLFIIISYTMESNSYFECILAR